MTHHYEDTTTPDLFADSATSVATPPAPPAPPAPAVTAEDDAPFRRVSGIGPKTAKLIVVQLAGKVQPRVAATPAAHAA